MKDTSVSPAGLLDTHRQQQLLDGLSKRFQNCSKQQAELQVVHARQRGEKEHEYGVSRAATTEACRTQRREMLAMWDEAEEKLTRHYEETAIRNRMDLNRLAQAFRQKAIEDLAVIK